MEKMTSVYFVVYWIKQKKRLQYTFHLYAVKVHPSSVVTNSWAETLLSDVLCRPISVSFLIRTSGKEYPSQASLTSPLQTSVWKNEREQMPTIELQQFLRPWRCQGISKGHELDKNAETHHKSSSRAWTTASPPPRGQQRQWRGRWTSEQAHFGESLHSHQPEMVMWM